MKKKKKKRLDVVNQIIDGSHYNCFMECYEMTLEVLPGVV